MQIPNWVIKYIVNIKIPNWFIKLVHKIPDEFLEKGLEYSLKAQSYSNKKFWNFTKFIGNLATGLFVYTLISGIFLMIYRSAGFEVTIIILLVGVINYAIKR